MTQIKTGDKVVVTRTVHRPGRQNVQEGSEGTVVGITGQGLVVVKMKDQYVGRMKRVVSVPQDTLKVTD